jgi:hypothetical protein
VAALVNFTQHGIKQIGAYRIRHCSFTLRHTCQPHESSVALSAAGDPGISLAGISAGTTPFGDGVNVMSNQEA